MTAIPVSVVVVSRDRPESLTRTLTAIAQLQYPRFEVVVVADPAGLEATRELAFFSDLKIVPFDQPNISRARNLGIAQAAGEVVAFIDDDAVPEPLWLHHLIAPAARPDVAAMGGFVRGRNGISYQWRARSLDRMGIAHDMQVDPVQPTVLTPREGMAIKTEGTNMAVRRDVLIELGGFDADYSYYLDETDLNLRLARAGHATALVPLAEVHHGFAANATRSAGRVPRDPFEIGASVAVLHAKHLSKADHASQWAQFRASERRRFLGHMVAGTVAPGQVAKLMARLDEGYEAGQSRRRKPHPPPRHAATPFLAFPAASRPHQMIVNRPSKAKQAREKAARLVAEGAIVTVLNMSPTTLYHRVKFMPEGYWQQSGGLFGKSERSDFPIRITTRSRRATREALRVARQRGAI